MMIVLRLVHILAGAFWFGALVFSARVLMPSARDAGPAAAPMMAQVGRRIPPLMMASAILTVGAGIWLMMRDAAIGGWMHTSMGRTFGAGGALAILAFIFGMVVNMPAARRMGTIGQVVAKRGGPPTTEESAELARIQKRLGMGTVVVTILIALATAAMAVARYMP
jgi:uncharacterized membrane protein